MGAEASFYLVFGLQGAGKTTWVKKHSQEFPARAVYLSGPLPSRKHRERALSIAKGVGCRCVGVWINEPFEVASERNARRKGAARVAEEVLLHVQQSLEPPSFEEGFDEVIEYRSDLAGGQSSASRQLPLWSNVRPPALRPSILRKEHHGQVFDLIP